MSVLLGVVVLVAAWSVEDGCEVTAVFVDWSVLELVLVEGVWLVTGGVVLAGACPVSVDDGCDAAAP